jgi:ABC-type Fe3+ transport system substrate-binding protein
MPKYMANQPYFIQGHRDVAARVRSGADFVSFDISNSSRIGGGNLKLVMSEKDKSPVFFTAGGILKDAPHPNAAKLFLTWILSKEQQGRVPAFYSPRRHAAAAGLATAVEPKFRKRLSRISR